jgi:hypothetical protein
MGGKKKEVKEKPLEKMTAKELREVAMEIPDITGVHGMNKAELIKEIKESRGIVDSGGSRKKKGDVREIKKKIQELRTKRETALETEDKKMAQILRRKISRLKKKTRQAA